MSNEVMGLCAPLQMPHPAKAVLMALADMQSAANGCAWPSLTKLQEYTCLSRSAVITAVKTLEASGVVEADRKDPRHTRYVVKPAAFIPPPLAKARKSRPFTSAPDALPPADKDAPASAPHALALVHVKDYQAQAAGVPAALPSAPAVLDLVHGADALVHGADPNHKEPKTEPKDNHKAGADGFEDFELDGSREEKPAAPKKKKPAGFDVAEMPLPDWLEREHWHAWVLDRKQRKHPIGTEFAAKLAFKALDKLRPEFTPQEVIENAIYLGWRGLFKPKKDFNSPQASTSRHSGLSSKDPSKGINDDGSFSL